MENGQQIVLVLGKYRCPCNNLDIGRLYYPLNQPAGDLRTGTVNQVWKTAEVLGVEEQVTAQFRLVVDQGHPYALLRRS